MTDYQLSKVTGLPEGTLWRWRTNLWKDQPRWWKDPATSVSVVTLMRYYRTNGDASSIQRAVDLAKNGIRTARHTLKFDLQ